MPTDRFFIAPFDANSGLQNNLKPFMIPDEAFALLNNAYCWRGRIRKRFGSRWLGNTQDLTRLRVNLLDDMGAPIVTDGAGDASGTVPAGAGAIGQMFSIGTSFYTVNALGTPANLLIDGVATTATFNTSNGDFVFTGAPAAMQVYWYPALPVMGLITFEDNPDLNEATIAFDTQYAYSYSGGWQRIAGEVTPGAATWTGDNSQFFWGTSWVGINAYDRVLFVTNFNAAEPNFMRFLFNNLWDNFRPQISAIGPIYLDAARILVVFHNRLLAFNTVENINGTQFSFPNRVRWSAPGSPLAATAWRQDIPGQGGSLDASTDEAVITVSFIKDRLIAFFEQSTWELAFTGNQIQPFTWQKINTELGAESTFSIVPFDKVVIGVGNVGVMACTGTNVDRIDEKIPDEIFKIHNSDNGIERVYGIRDFYVEMTYWTFPNPDSNATFPYPNRVLVYNYKNGTWSFNDDSITAFGYFQPQAPGTLWSDTTIRWDSDVTWFDGSIQSLFRQVIAGNQEGWTFLVDSDEPTNCPALQITNLMYTPLGLDTTVTITAIDHNLREGDFVFIDQISSSGNLDILNGMIFAVIVAAPENANTFSILYTGTTALNGTYTGGGVMARVSRIQLLTKQYNFYQDKGRNAYVSRVDFLVDSTEYGEIQVDFFVSTSDESMVGYGQATGTLLGTGILETFPYPTVPLELTSSQLWHPYYLQADGEYIQLNIRLNDEEMMDPLVRISEFELHRMIFHAMPTSWRLQ